MTEQFSTPSKDCITEDEQKKTVKPPSKKASDKPDISHLVYIRRSWKAEIKTSKGTLTEFSHKADELNEFLAIIKEKFTPGYHIMSIIGGG
jgi:hypothetical protein